MVMKDCLEKNVQKKVLIEKHREYYLVLDEETGAIFLVNKRHTFCMKIVMDKVSKVCVNCFLINALIRISWTKGLYTRDVQKLWRHS